ncbi:MAG: sigma-70 family RNA polymerase sigma factor [Bacteroidota bacterium]
MSQIHFPGYNKQKYTEAEILTGVVNNSDKMISYIYRSYFPGIKSMVYGFHSLVLDAEDIFQDGLIAAMRNVSENRFNGNSTFNTYLTSICRNICFKQMDLAKKMQAASSHKQDEIQTEINEEELIERLTLIKDKMDDKCKQIIDLRFGVANANPLLNALPNSESNVRFDEIALVLQIEPDNARQRFKRCLEKLRETVMNDKTWNEIITSTY